ELIATVLKPAEMERQRIETLAQAGKQKSVFDADGSAEAVRLQGQADADVIRVKGQAEAEIIRVRGQAEAEIIKAKGEAEAEAMQVKAAAFKQYNQAAVVDKMLDKMPAVVEALAQPLSQVDRITV